MTKTTRRPWIGVDFDGTLALDGGNHDNPAALGEPVPLMLARVKAWLAEGMEVRIVTARVSPPASRYAVKARAAIRAWCVRHLGRALKVTCSKDMDMLELWDDRAVRVITNTGYRA